MATTTMAPDVLAAKIKEALGLIEEVGDQMNDRQKSCKCCGLSVRENMDDYQGKQALDACSQRLAKLYEKLYEGAWEGREIAPVMNASAVRAGSKP